MTGELLDQLLDPRGAIRAIVARDGTITRVTPAAHGLLGGELGAAVESLFDAASRDKLADALACAPVCCELQASPAGRDPIPVQVSVVRLDEHEHLLVITGTGPSYSEPMARQLLSANDRLANLARELARQSAELEAARTRFEGLADLREHFISMLAHDVRGALQAIAFGTDIIERSPARISAANARIRRTTERISALVESVLEAARSEAGRMVIAPRPTSLRDLARDVIELYTPTADRAQVQIALVDDGGDASVPGDPVRLGQVFGNLLENAIRHSPAGTTVSFVLTTTPDTVRGAIRDQGPGIPPDLRGQLFERYVQGRGTTGSLGLGLYVARQIVELHRGHISVEEVEPHGAAFVVELPRVHVRTS